MDGLLERTCGPWSDVSTWTSPSTATTDLGSTLPVAWFFTGPTLQASILAPCHPSWTARTTRWASWSTSRRWSRTWAFAWHADRTTSSSRLATLIGSAWLGRSCLLEFGWSVWGSFLSEDGWLDISAIPIGFCCGNHHLSPAPRFFLGSQFCWRSSPSSPYAEIYVDYLCGLRGRVIDCGGGFAADPKLFRGPQGLSGSVPTDFFDPLWGIHAPHWSCFSSGSSHSTIHWIVGLWFHCQTAHQASQWSCSSVSLTAHGQTWLPLHCCGPGIWLNESAWCLMFVDLEINQFSEFCLRSRAGIPTGMHQHTHKKTYPNHTDVRFNEVTPKGILSTGNLLYLSISGKFSFLVLDTM